MTYRPALALLLAALTPAAALRAASGNTGAPMPAPTPGRSPRLGARCGYRRAGRWLSARRRRRWGSSRSLICAGLLVCVTEAPLLAQSTADRTEFAVGGGFHVSPDITDFIQLPAVPTVNVRVTRWLNDRWGITGNVIAGVGSGGRELDRGVHDRLAAQAERAGIRWPSKSANVCRTLPGSRRSTRQPTNPATSPYTFSAALRRTAPPSELVCG